MNILYASDDNYAELAGISLLSLYENNKEIESINTFIFDDGITDENKNKIYSIAEKYGRQVVFLKVGNIIEKVGLNIDLAGYAWAMLFRLFVGTVLPKSVERIIYLDCDTMVRASLRPLWEQDLEGNIVGGVLDYARKIQKRFIFLKNADAYINSGVLLIDLKTWREQDVEAKCIHFIKIFDGKFLFPDQDILNGVLRYHIKLINPIYNCSIEYLSNSRDIFLKRVEGVPYYSKDIFDEAKRNPCIFHFFNYDSRPWIKGNTHVFQDEYFAYRNMSPWSMMPLRVKVQQGSAGYKLARNILRRILPKPMRRTYGDFRMGILAYQKRRVAIKRLRHSDIKLEDCYVKYIKKEPNAPL